MSVNTIQLKQLKQKLEQTLTETEQHNRPVLVKRGNQLVAWIVSPDWVEAICTAAEVNKTLWQQMSDCLAEEIRSLHQ
jgi:hypothetical protein